MGGAQLDHFVQHSFCLQPPRLHVLRAPRSKSDARRRAAAVAPSAFFSWSAGATSSSGASGSSSGPAAEEGNFQLVADLPESTTAVVGDELVLELDQQWPEEGPIISCGGGGIYFFWMIGVLKYVSNRYDLRNVTLIGASAGGLIAALTACEVDLDAAVQRAYQMAVEHKVWERPLGLVGVWGPLVRQWLDELLPDDAHERCSGGRVRVIATELPSLRQVYLQDFGTKAELLDALMASAHVPLFLDGRPWTKARGKRYMDGSLQDFIAWDNSPLLKCGGRAWLLDYSADEALAVERFDFLKVRVIDEVLQMIRLGYKYARTLDRQGGLEKYLGDVRLQ